MFFLLHTQGRHLRTLKKEGESSQLHGPRHLRERPSHLGQPGCGEMFSHVSISIQWFIYVSHMYKYIYIYYYFTIALSIVSILIHIRTYVHLFPLIGRVMASSRRQNLQLTKHAGVTPAEDLKEVHVWCCSPVTFGFVSNHEVYIYIHMYYMCIYIYILYLPFKKTYENYRSHMVKCLPT